MTDEDGTKPARRRPAEQAERARSGEPPARSARPRRRPSDGVGQEEHRADGAGARRNGLSASAAARRAVAELVALTGRDFESIVSIERDDGGWKVGVEVVESHRIPDSADILANFEVRLDADGELCGYRRVGRYNRGMVRR